MDALRENPGVHVQVPKPYARGFSMVFLPEHIGWLFMKLPVAGEGEARRDQSFLEWRGYGKGREGMKNSSTYIDLQFVLPSSMLNAHTTVTGAAMLLGCMSKGRHTCNRRSSSVSGERKKDSRLTSRLEFNVRCPHEPLAEPGVASSALEDDISIATQLRRRCVYHLMHSCVRDVGRPAIHCRSLCATICRCQVVS